MCSCKEIHHSWNRRIDRMGKVLASHWRPLPTALWDWNEWTRPTEKNTNRKTEHDGANEINKDGWFKERRMEKKRTLKPNKNASTPHTTYDFPMGPDNGKWWFLVVYTFFPNGSVWYLLSCIIYSISLQPASAKQYSECVIHTVFLRVSSHISCE